MPEKKDTPNYTEWNIFKKLAFARVEIAKRMGKKSGFNKYGNFAYFELQDIIPHMIEVFNTVGLIGIEGHEDAIIEKEAGYEVKPELYTLTIYNTDRMDDKPIKFVKKFADAATKGQLPIQSLGAVSTYMRRYLWMDALEIVENDTTDAKTKSGEDAEPVIPVRMATSPQRKIIEASGINIDAMFRHYNIRGWDQLTAQMASEVIAKKKLEDKQHE